MKKSLLFMFALLYQNFLFGQSVIKAEKKSILTMQEKEILSESFTSYDLMSLESTKFRTPCMGVN